MNMQETLRQYPTASLRIPVDYENDKNETVECALNGVLYRIKRGETVEVPYPVYLMLRNRTWHE